MMNEIISSDLFHVTRDEVLSEPDPSNNKAMLMVTLSTIAYDEKNSIREMCRSIFGGNSKCEFLEVGNNFGYVVETPGFRIFVYRGTDNIADWMTNVRIKLVKPSLGTTWFSSAHKVHRGFWDAFSEMYWKQSSVRGSIIDIKPTFITGHSLGGALATMHFMAMEMMGMSKPTLYTFGSPRCVGVNLAKYLNGTARSRMVRFVNENDCVTRVAPRSFGYSHVGTLGWLDGNTDSIEYDPCKWEMYMERLSASFEGFLELDSVSFVENHMVEQYADKIQLVAG